MGIGLGHDIHRLVPGRPLVLGGVPIEAEVGFDTHSVVRMKINIAGALGLAPDRVSVKARSNDGIGPEGEGTAAAASAVVLLREPGETG